MITVSFTFHGSFASKGIAHKNQRGTRNWYETNKKNSTTVEMLVIWISTSLKIIIIGFSGALWQISQRGSRLTPSIPITASPECWGSHLNKQNQTQMTCVCQENSPSLAPWKRNRKHVESQVWKGTANRRREKNVKNVEVNTELVPVCIFLLSFVFSFKPYKS